VGDRLGGHFVQGHVDGVATVEDVRQQGDARLVDLALPPGLAELMVPHGSVAVDGVSLTVNDLPSPGTATQARTTRSPSTSRIQMAARSRDASSHQVPGPVLKMSKARAPHDMTSMFLATR
jgi:riboflavin synthase